MKVVSLETGEPLSPGQEGELCFSGPNVGISTHLRNTLTDQAMYNPTVKRIRNLTAYTLLLKKVHLRFNNFISKDSF